MKQKRTSIDYLQDTLEAIQKIAQFIDGMTYESFSSDDKTIFAVLRGLEIIGEASKNISTDLKDA